MVLFATMDAIMEVVESKGNVKSRQCEVYLKTLHTEGTVSHGDH